MSDIMIDPADLMDFKCGDCAAMDRRHNGPVRFCLRLPPDNETIPKHTQKLVQGILRDDVELEVKSFLRTVGTTTPACMMIVPLKPKVTQ